jgi:hypothetical protein
LITRELWDSVGGFGRLPAPRRVSVLLAAKPFLVSEYVYQPAAGAVSAKYHLSSIPGLRFKERSVCHPIDTSGVERLNETKSRHFEHQSVG